MSKGEESRDLRALRNLIFEAQKIVSTTNLPQGRTAAAIEQLDAAVALADYLLTLSPASVLGKRGGAKMAERGSAYFRRISKMRKTHKGGRPKGTGVRAS